MKKPTADDIVVEFARECKLAGKSAEEFLRFLFGGLDLTSVHPFSPGSMISKTTGFASSKIGDVKNMLIKGGGALEGRGAEKFGALKVQTTEVFEKYNNLAGSATQEMLTGNEETQSLLQPTKN